MNIDWNPDNIKRLREVLGLSVDNMASNIGVTTSQLEEIEAGKRFATMYLLARIASLYHHNLHRIKLSLREGDKADGLGFLGCIQETFPLSSGGSTVSPPSNLASAFLDLLIPVMNEEYVRERIRECAERSNIEVLDIKINYKRHTDTNR